MSANTFTQKLLFVSALSAALMFLFSCKEKITDSGDGVVTMRDELTDPSVDPKVLWTFPADNSTGPFTAFNSTSTHYFTVQFNKLMNLNSFTSGTVRIKGFNTTVYGYLYQSQTQYTQILQFYMRNSQTGNTVNYEIGKTYSVELDSTIEDIHGKRLGKIYTFTFTPEPYFRIRTIYPADGDTLLATPYSSSSNPYIYFNSPVPSSSLSAIHISPVVSGKWFFDSYSPNYIYFSPTASLAFSTTYQITIDQGMKDKYGNTLPQQFTSSFFTPPFKVISTSPQDGSTDVSLYSGTSINIYLSGPVDYSTLNQSFSITPAIQGDFSSSNYDNRIYFYTNSSLAPGTTYTCSLSTTLKAKNGTSLSAPYTFSFTTQQFRVNYTNPNNGSTNVSTTSNITIEFNAPVEQSSAASAFSISPAVQGTFSFSSGSNYISFYPSQPLKSGTTYTVTLSTAMKSISGGSLEEPYEFQFTTAPFRVTSAYPSNNSYDVNASYIDINFSGAIDTGTVRNAFSITPAVSGYFNFYTSEFQFSPYNRFAMGKKYTVTLSTALKSKDGSSLQTPYTFSFTTMPFQITNVSPYDGSTGVSRYSSIYIYTNANVNMSSVSKAFSISPAVTGTFYDYGNGFSMFPQNQLAANTLYTVTVSTSLKAVSGDTLQTGRIFSFTTGQ